MLNSSTSQAGTCGPIFLKVGLIPATENRKKTITTCGLIFLKMGLLPAIDSCENTITT